ncbi:MAG: TIGR03619 family F420-dependent LLM class oxidoreductase [Actinomycetota bacterium]
MKIGINLPVADLQEDLGAIADFARAADELGYNHLIVPDRVLRQEEGHRHEVLMLLAYIAAITERIELVPSVVISPSRQTPLLAKQVCELEVLSGGRVRFGVGVGASAAEYEAQGADFSTRGVRLEEQIEVLRRLWTEETVSFDGRFHTIDQCRLEPRPGAPIPIWIGAGRLPGRRITDRMGRLADGWFALCGPDDFGELSSAIDEAAVAAGRDPGTIGSEAVVPIVGEDNADWRDRVERWREAGVTHLALRTVRAGLPRDQQIRVMTEAADGLLDG